MLHHRNRLISVEVCLPIQARQAKQRALGISDPASPDEPPGRFGCKGNADEERDRPHPLQGVGDAVGPLISAAEHGFDHADADYLAEAPAEVDVGGEVAAEGNGADF